jgi:hypothetical protein
MHSNNSGLIGSNKQSNKLNIINKMDMRSSANQIVNTPKIKIIITVR